MSSIRQDFAMAASAGDWRQAFYYLNGMSMYDMLHTLDHLKPQVLNALADRRGSYADGVNMPRMEYAMFVVQQRTLPAFAPGDLSTTGQVQDAINFLRAKSEPIYTGNEPAVPLDLSKPVDPDVFFDVSGPHVPLGTRPIFDDATHAVVGYVYQSYGFYKYFDVCGTFVASDEIGLEEPIIDPIDVVLIVGDLAQVVAKGILKAGVRAAARAGTRIALRALAAGALETMRTALRRLVTRELKFTATTAARMASKDRHVPVQILQLAIRFGKRTADPQGVKGAFRYAIKMFRNDVEYVLEVVLREHDSTVLHFQYGRHLPL